MSGSATNRDLTCNQLLAALPQEAFASLQPKLEIVPLVFKQTIYAPQELITHIYFPTHGLISLLTIMADKTAAEVSVVGKEGMLGIPVFLGVDTTPFRAIVQIPGEAMRMRVDDFKLAVNRISSFSSWIQRYIYSLLIQIVQSSACNSHHTVEQRCCRWLLSMHDNAMSDRFLITQEFLSHMLGVRRASVTEVAGKLQKAGLLGYSRGQMTIYDRQGLEAASCECYALVRAEFERLFSST